MNAESRIETIEPLQGLMYRTLEDREFREKLETNPAEALKESGISFPSDLERLLIERDPAILHFMQRKVQQLPEEREWITHVNVIIPTNP
jgi:hypothetical protein